MPSPLNLTSITATKTIGILNPPGQWSIRIYETSGGATWNGATATLQYSEDGGTTWRNVAVLALVGVTADMANGVAMLAGQGIKFRLEITVATPELDFSAAYVGPS